jgi:ubiquitin-protein ligase E3 A
LGSLVNPNQSHNATFNQIIASSHFTLKIRRDNILTDSLNALVGQNVNIQ